MDRKTLLAVVLVTLLILAWPYWMKLVSPPAPPQPVESAPTETRADSLKLTRPEAPPLPPVLESAPAGKSQTPDLTAAKDSLALEEKTATVITPLFTTEISNLGARMTRFTLAKFKDGHGIPVDLIGPEERGTAPVLSLAGNRRSLDFSQRPFKLSDTLLNLAGDKSDSLVLETSDGEYPSARLVYRFSAKEYLIGFSVELSDTSHSAEWREYSLQWRHPLPYTELKGTDQTFVKMSYRLGEAFDHETVGKKDSLVFSIEGDAKWVAASTKYFLAAVIAPNDLGQGIQASGLTRKITRDNTEVIYQGTRIGIHADWDGTRRRDDWSIYLGPIDYRGLKAFNNGMEHIVDLGWKFIRYFGIALLWLFLGIYKIIPHYGAVILIFALLVKVATYPLTASSMKSMAKLKSLEPQMKEMRERYAKDPKKLNTETMKLYKEAKVNPLGGCLPLILQMPIFFGLYKVLYSAIELRQAPMGLWITDLSGPDPYMVLPLLMSATMFLQQKITITDPQQKMMIYLMPVIFFFLFKSMPAGLVLYWTTFNVLSIFHQLWMNKQKAAEDAAVTSPLHSN